jgi:hypothetical protein
MAPKFSGWPPQADLMKEKVMMNPKKVAPVYQFKITLRET